MIIADRTDLPLSPPLLVARTVWLEILRREEYAAFLILMGLYVVFAAAARLAGLNSAESACFLLNMGLVASSFFAALLTAATAARVIPAELERRTLYVLLAKPLQRHELILGKFLASTFAGWMALLGFCAATWLCTVRLPEHQPLLLAQALGLQLVALALLAALGMCLSLALPASAALLLTLGLYAFGSVLVNVLRPVGGAAAAVLAYVPDFGKLNLLTRYTDGGPPLPWADFAGLMLYGVAITLFVLWLSVRLFERRSL